MENHGFAPHYFDDPEYVPSRSLSSGDRDVEKHFSAPVLWNALPSNVRNAKSIIQVWS